MGRGTSLGDFVAGLDDPGNKWTWDVVDADLVARRWADVVGADRVHVDHDAGGARKLLAAVGPVLRDGRPGRGRRRRPAAAGQRVAVVQAARLLQEFGPALRAEIDQHDRAVRSHSRWLRGAVVRQVLTGVPGDPIGVGPELGTRSPSGAPAPRPACATSAPR